MPRGNRALILAGLLVLLPMSLFSTTINVPAEQITIQAGINASVDGDTVLVQPRVYPENIDFSGKNITVRSLYATSGDTAHISATIIDGSASGRVVTFENGESSDAQLIGFTLRNGTAQGGAGIFCSSASPTIRDNIIRANTADYGSGIACWFSSPSIVNNVIDSNVATGVGAGIALYFSNPTIDSNKIVANVISADTAVFGSGIACYVSHPNITHNEIAYNIGGGIGCNGSNPNISDNLIHHNTAEWGGGMYCTGSNPTIVRNTFAFNSAKAGGGVLLRNSNPPIFSNNIIVFGGQGAAITCADGNPAPPILCSNIYGNVGGDWTGGIEGLDLTNGNISADPLFCDTTAVNYALQEASPCAPLNNTCSVYMGSVASLCSSVAPSIQCTTDTLRSQTCTFDNLCFEVAIEFFDAVWVEGAVAADWSNDTLCVTTVDTGHYALEIIAENAYGADTCALVVHARYLDPPVISCPLSAVTETIASPGTVCIDLPVTGATDVTASGATWTDDQLCFDADTSGLYEVMVTAINDCVAETCLVAVDVETTYDWLTVSADTLYFSGFTGGTTLPTQNFYIDEVSGRSIDWTVSNINGVSWLTFSSFSGNTPDIFSITPDISGMTKGIYRDSIEVSSTTTVNAPFWVHLVLELSDFCEYGCITLDSIEGFSGLGSIPSCQTVDLFLRWENQSGNAIVSTSNAFSISSPSGASWITTSIDITGLLNETHFDGGIFMNAFGITGDGADTVAISATQVSSGTGMLDGFSGNVVRITIGPIDSAFIGQTIVLDASSFRHVPNFPQWEWTDSTGTKFQPDWGGPYALTVTALACDSLCCGEYTGGYPGNTNSDTQGKRNLADITKLIDHVYISKADLPCNGNGNVNGDEDSKHNLTDIILLIDHVYISKAEVPPCGSALPPSGTDAGAPDTVLLIPSVLEAGGNDSLFTLELWIKNDANGVVPQFGFSWDSDLLMLDSAIASPEAMAAFLFNSFYDMNLATSNANNRAIYAGISLNGSTLAPNASRHLVATYYFTVTGWTVTSEIVIDTSRWDDGSEMLFVDQSIGEYTPVWLHGPNGLVIHDPNEVQCCGEYTSGYTGNTDCSIDGRRNLIDIAVLIGHIYLSKLPLCCNEEGNVNGDLQGKHNLADIVGLIDYIYISHDETAVCE